MKSAGRCWSRVFALVAIAVALLLMGVCSAYAASTYFDQYPAAGGTCSESMPRISVKVSDPAGVSGSPQLKIDGVSKAVKTKWGPGNAYLELYYQVPSALSNGQHTIYASVFTGAGRTSTTWTFTQRVAPVVGPLAPADGTTVNTQKPAISAVVNTGSSALAAYTMAVDGVSVSPSFDSATKTLSYTPFQRLANDRSHTVTLTATDSTGASTTVSWSFYVQIYASMVDTQGCTVSGCHPSYPTDHPMDNCNGCHAQSAPFPAYWNMDNPSQYAHESDYLQGIDCAYCHASQFPDVARHPADLDASHRSSVDMSGCSCHVADLTIEHTRYKTDAGEDITCASCHSSTDPIIQAGMAKGTRYCLDCHGISATHPYGDVDHIADVAEVSDISGKKCSKCHDMDLYTEHEKASSSSDNNGCATCHNATFDGGPADLLGAWNQTCTQGGCHAAGTETAMHANQAAAHEPPTGLTCTQAGCHTGDVAAIHSSAATTTVEGIVTSCSLCHKNDPAGTSTTTAKKYCPDCHTADHESLHTPTPPRADACVSCHPGESLTTVHIVNNGLTCETCHDSTVPAVVAAIAAGNLNCAACHPGDSHASADHTSNETCGGCHSVTDLTSIHADNCAVCHSQNIQAGWWTSQSCEQSGCHATRHPGLQHAGDHGEGDDCFYCHDPYNDWAGCGDCHFYDRSAPSTTSNAKASYVSTAVIKLTPNDPGGTIKATYYRVDGGAIQTGTTITVQGPATGIATHTIEFWSQDTGLNTERPHKFATFTVSQRETVPPVTVSNAAPAYVGTANITLTASDGAGSGVAATYYKLDGGAQTAGTAITVPAGAWNTNISHTLQFWSVDVSGNTEATKSVTFTVAALPDNVKPVTASSISGGGWYMGDQTFTLSPSDTGGSALAATYWQLDSTSGTWNTGTSAAVAAPASGNATHTLYWYSRDNAGNVELTKSASFTLRSASSTGVYTSTVSGTDNAWLDTAPGSSGAWGTYRIYANDVLIGTKAADGSTTWNCPETALSGSPSHIDITYDCGFTSQADVFGEDHPKTATILLPTGATKLEAATWTGFTGVQSGYAYWDDDYESDFDYVYVPAPTIGNIVWGTSTSWETVAPTGTMAVNNGAAYTSAVAATVNSVVTDAGSGMGQMSVDPGTGYFGPWVAYQASCPITLPNSIGVKTVRVKYRDAVGNITTLTDTITIERTAPVGTMSVNNWTAWTGSTAATVNSAITDTQSGVSQMSVDPGTGTYGSWIPYSATSAITLPAGTGIKTVRVQYRDGAGNVLTLTDTILLDQTAPATTSEAISGKNYIGNQVFALVPTDVGGSGLANTYWQLDGTGGAWTSGTSATVNAPATGSATDTLYWYSRDNAGNTESINSVAFTVQSLASNDTYSTSLSIPSNTWMDCDGGASGAYGTYKIYVNDALIATKQATADTTWDCPQMTIPTGSHIDITVDCGWSNYGAVFGSDTPKTFTYALPYGATRLEAATWTGFSVLHAEYTEWDDYYEDAATFAWLDAGTINNIMFTSSLAYDTTAPTGTMSVNSGATYTGSTSATVNSAVSDASAGVYDMSVDPGTGAYGPWVSYASSYGITMPANTGLKTVKVRYRDRVGNILTLTDTIQLDQTAPTSTSNITNGATYTGNKTVTFSGSDTGGSGLAGYWYQLDGGTWTNAASLTVTAPSSGSAAHTLKWYAKDNAGNSEAQKTVAFTLNAAPQVATLEFHWWDGTGYAELHVENSSGVTIASTSLSGYDSDLTWQVTVPAGQNYRMVCDYYEDWDWGGSGGGYGIWSNDTSINPDGILSVGETVGWGY